MGGAAGSLEANRVYVIPPNQYLAIRNGVLYLAKPVMQHGIRMPIDFFFRSLAEDRKERALCILFSGAGSDGTLGIRAVRGGGGLTIAQDPRTAQFGDMPSSALATGLVDFMLAPESKRARLFRRLAPPCPIALDTQILPGKKRALSPAVPVAGLPPAIS